MKFYAEPKLTYSIARGDVYVGNLVAQSAGIEEGDTIEIFGTSLKVKNVLSRVGGKEDIRIYGHLHDIQQSLDLKGEINEIEALECLCMMNTTKGVDPWEKAERQLAQILPQGKVIRKTTMAEMRSQYRSVIESYLVFIIPIVLILSGSWIAILAMNNVRARLSEIAIMKTVGFTSGRIALVFIGKSILAGLVGAGFGCAAGALLALNFAPRIFKVTAKAITIDPKLMVLSVFLAVVFMITWSLIPMVYGILQEPADVLGKE
jgi:putative ABC transport system permease protein